MGTVALAAQLLLAGVFLTAAIGKFMDLEGSRKALVDFGVPRNAAPALGTLLPVAELLAAILLVPVPTARWGAALALALLLAFIAGISSALARGKAPDCHCFGQIHSKPAGRGTLVRNGVLAAIALVVVVNGAGTALDEWVADRSAAELVAVGTSLLAAGIAAYAAHLWVDRRTIKTNYEIVQAELEQLPPGLPVGLKAPGFALNDIDGNTRTLVSFLEDDTPAMLIFTGPRCSACKAMMPEVARWQDALEGRLNIVIVSGGTPTENLPMVQEHGVKNVVLQEDYEVMWEYRVRATPSAVVVAPDMTVATLPATGAVSIEPLIRLALSRETITPGRSFVTDA